MKFKSPFTSNIKDIYGEDGAAWLKNLPHQVNQICDHRGLRFLKVMPDLSYNFVAAVEIPAINETAILKIAPNNDVIGREAIWLQCFDKGVPKVFWFDEAQHALLMEHLSPGESLKPMALINDEEATRIICRLIVELQSHQHRSQDFVHLSELAPALTILQDKVDEKLFSQAKTWFAELTAERAIDVLLHGDLHHDNILSSGQEWKAIDPHGYIGDPAFASSTMIYNPGEQWFPKDKSIEQVIHNRLQILIEELPYDPKRIHAWAFCMTMLSIAWTLEGHGHVPAFELRVAEILQGIEVQRPPI